VTDIVLRAVRVNGRFEPVEFGDGMPVRVTEAMRAVIADDR
jgi:hypothetical protein